MPSAEKQDEKCSREQRLKLAALIVEHNHAFAGLSKKAAQFWINNPGPTVVFAAEFLEEKFRHIRDNAQYKTSG